MTTKALSLSTVSPIPQMEIGKPAAVPSSPLPAPSRILGPSAVGPQFSYQDRQRLRAVVREVLRRDGVPVQHLTDYECDKWIDAVAPDTAEKMIRFAVEQARV